MNGSGEKRRWRERRMKLTACLPAGAIFASMGIGHCWPGPGEGFRMAIGKSGCRWQGWLLGLALFAPVAAWAQTYTDNTAGAVADVACFTRTLVVPVALVVADLNVQVDINHTWRADLDITLTSPLATAIDLSSDNGGSADNLKVLFDDAAATAITADAANHAAIVTRRPEVALSAFNGVNAAGTWSLRVCDDEALDVGTFNGWSLVFTGANANVAVTKTNTPGVNGNVDQAADAINEGATTVYTIVVSNSGPQAANGALLQDPATPGLTCSTVVCSAAGGAACPGGAVNGAGVVVPLASLRSGVAIPTLPNGGSVTVLLTCVAPNY